jgi:F0F1-type ATP synthase assembly protein I
MPGQNTEKHQAPNEAMESLFHTTTGYVETRLEIARLKAVEKSADAASTIFAMSVVFLVAFLCFILLNIGIALLIGQWMGTLYWGFIILGAFYAVIALLLYSARNSWLKSPVNDSIIKKVLSP